jgi:hypothetical protein
MNGQVDEYCRDCGGEDTDCSKTFIFGKCWFPRGGILVWGEELIKELIGLK